MQISEVLQCYRSLVDLVAVGQVTGNVSLRTRHLPLPLSRTHTSTRKLMLEFCEVVKSVRCVCARVVGSKKGSGRGKPAFMRCQEFFVCVYDQVEAKMWFTVGEGFSGEKLLEVCARLTLMRGVPRGFDIFVHVIGCILSHFSFELPPLDFFINFKPRSRVFQHF